MNELEKKRAIDAYAMRIKGRLPTADEEKAWRMIIDYVERNPVPKTKATTSTPQAPFRGPFSWRNKWQKPK